jgi:hypothetical protein
MMSKSTSIRSPIVDWLTVVAIAAIAISLNVAFHEGVHALTCLVVGGNLEEYSALYESCGNASVLQAKIEAGSAPTLNLIAGTILWFILRKFRKQIKETWLFLWLLMVMNWLYGAGYFVLSGIAYIGDWAVVMEGWKHVWLWRVLITVVGLSLYILFVLLAFRELGWKIGGEAGEQIQRARKICTLSYITSFAVILMAGFFCPYGLLGLPVWAGLIAVLGTLSPLLWMMRWFHTDYFVKPTREPLEIHRKWQWIAASIIVVFMYVFILGRTLYF